MERQLKEGLFKLSISLLTTPLETWSVTSSHLLTYFTGALSLDLRAGPASKYSFVPITQSTSILLGLIWISRILFLEYALP